MRLCVYRLIGPQDVHQVVNLHRSVFPAEQLARTIFATYRVRSYIKALVALPAFRTEHVLIGAWAGKDLAGYAHFQAMPDAWRLNQIAVRPEYQGCGIGSELWQLFIKLGQQRGKHQVSLDVESDQHLARRWYERKGLTLDSTVWTYERPVSISDSTVDSIGGVKLLDWEQAEAWQLTYGFSEFRVAIGSHTWRIGRLGERYFTITQPIPNFVEEVLAPIGPFRRLLIRSSKPLPGEGVKELGVSFRLRGPCVSSEEDVNVLSKKVTAS